jgi:hypothetical protein
MFSEGKLECLLKAGSNGGVPYFQIELMQSSSLFPGQMKCADI